VVRAVTVWLVGIKLAPNISPPVIDIPKMTVKKLHNEG